MAEIETKRSAHSKKRSNKKSSRVDLTPMVDLGFLLLTFFVFTTTLAAPKAMDVRMPYKTPPDDKICESCVLTVLLDEGNRIKYYEGKGDNKSVIKETGFSATEIRKVLMDKKEAVQQVRGDADAFILIIKASEKSNFKNFVDITDEVTISAIKRYYICELTEQDKRILLKK